MAVTMGHNSDPAILDRLDRAVLKHMLRCEPDAALATQLASAGIVRREFFGPNQITYFKVGAGAFPAHRNSTIGGYTYARLPGRRSPAAFTLHLDDGGWMSHLIAFMDDDSIWPDKITAFEVFSTKASVPPQEDERLDEAGHL